MTTFLDAYLQAKIPNYQPGSVDPNAVGFAAAMDAIRRVEPEVCEAVIAELRDQRSHLKLIASENFAPPEVLLAMGNWLSDKYAEGTPGHRFYAGCENVDVIESRAVALAKEVFGADHAYVQPHSGIDANLVAFWSILTHRIENPRLAELGHKSPLTLSDDEWETLRRELGEQKMMGMALDAGGHLTHGFRPNVSGKLFKYCAYSVDPQTNQLDYDQVRQRAREEKPLVLVAGYSSYPRKINFRIFREIADEVGATLMVDMAHFAGLVAGKVFTDDFNPVQHAHVVTTTTHKTLRGPRGGLVLCQKEFADTVDRGCPLVLGGPLSHVMASKALALKLALSPDYQEYQQRVVRNASALATALQQCGATIITGGTDNHLLLVDVRPYGLSGRQAETALREAGITLNRNVIPNDPNGAWYTSGLRLGTPALTTLGMGEAEMGQIASLIHNVLEATTAKTTAAGSPSMAKYLLPEAVRSKTADAAKELLQRYPLYPGIEL